MQRWGVHGSRQRGNALFCVLWLAEGRCSFSCGTFNSQDSLIECYDRHLKFFMMKFFDTKVKIESTWVVGDGVASGNVIKANVGRR